MNSIDYENFMRWFRPLCTDIHTIVEQQNEIIKLLKNLQNLPPNNGIQPTPESGETEQSSKSE